jgi:hypothetical protein
MKKVIWSTVSFEDIVTGAMPWIPKINFLNPCNGSPALTAAHPPAKCCGEKRWK